MWAAQSRERVNHFIQFLLTHLPVQVFELRVEGAALWLVGMLGGWERSGHSREQITP